MRVITLKKILTLSSVLVFSSLSAIVQATPATPSWTEIIGDTSSFQIESHVFQFSPHSDHVFFVDGFNPTPDSPNAISELVQLKFSLSTELKTVSYCDVSSCNDASANGFGKTSGSFTSAGTFNYLALHYGLGEILLHFALPQSTFSFSGLPRGLSNFRSYSDAQDVPEPNNTAMLLVGLGLMGFVVVQRRT